LTEDQNTPLSVRPGERPAMPRDTEDVYERPEIIDYGTLTQLTLSGLGPQTDSLLSSGS
jgi:hypothetical protein